MTDTKPTDANGRRTYPAARSRDRSPGSPSWVDDKETNQGEAADGRTGA